MSTFGVTLNEASMPSFKWRRVLLKVSGEALAGDNQQNIDPKVYLYIILILIFYLNFFCSSE